MLKYQDPNVTFSDVKLYKRIQESHRAGYLVSCCSYCSQYEQLPLESASIWF